MGGATARGDCLPGYGHGLSPRGRGNPGPEPAGGGGHRSIPAWAGQPYAWLPSNDTEAVYPRVGGATQDIQRPESQVMGLSPRGRGNHAPESRNQEAIGSIPAWAGQPPKLPQSFCPGRGLSPRGRGNRNRPAHGHRPTRSIPAWAGNQLVFVPAVEDVGSIPAWAGQPGLGPWSSLHGTVYPRVGGATEPCSGFVIPSRGLSPRGRGNPTGDNVDDGGQGSIPAWAGQPSSGLDLPRFSTVYPRVGGATLKTRVTLAPFFGLSPRGRGNPPRPPPPEIIARSIPAWAGQPISLDF